MHTIIHIGAGRGEELDSYLSSTAEQIVLVEPQPDLAAGLRERVGDNHRVSIIEAAVSPEGAGDQLHRFNLAEASSLYEPTGLKEMFPGLKTEAKLTVDTVSPAQLLATYPIPETKEAKLIIDAPGAEVGILQDLLRHKDGLPFSEIQVVSPHDALYSSGSNAHRVIHLLEETGFEQTQPNHNTPDWPCWQFQRNPLQSALDQARDDNCSLATQLSKLERELAQAREHMLEAKNAAAVEREQLKSQLENEKKKVEGLSSQIELARKQQEVFNSIESSLKSLNKNNLNEFRDLESKLENFFVRQSRQLHDAANALGRHVTQSVDKQRRHMESALSVQNYLQQGEIPLAFGGWAIGYDLAAYLVQVLEQNNFDLVIEFGSGTSTVLLAKTVLKTLSPTQNANNTERLDQPTESIRNSKNLTLSYHDLPRRILSFEQDQSYYQETRSQLQQNGVDALVELVRAPLVPTPYANDLSQSTDPLFYDCEAKISQLPQLFHGRRAKILVLIDGPYSPQSDPLARAPALGILLQYFSSHQLHCVLDDAQRSGEREIMEYWTELCLKRGLPMNQKIWSTEKGACYFVVNPD